MGISFHCERDLRAELMEPDPFCYIFQLCLSKQEVLALASTVFTAVFEDQDVNIILKSGA